MKNEDIEKSHIEAANVPALTANRRNWIIGGLGMAAGLAGALVAWQKFEPHAVMDEAVQNFWTQSFEKPEGGNLSMQAFQGKGLGEALLRHAIQINSELGRSKLCLSVDAGNESGALRLYEKVGMKPISEWHQYENLNWSK